MMTSSLQVGEAQALMKRALALASRGRGYVEPNPMVGCVIAKPLPNGRLTILGEGYHQHFGQPHAEVNALADAVAKGHDPEGAVVAVTLEPCSHHGKTPPCAEALIKAGVQTVYIAMPDPFEQVNGQGIAKLREAGIEVHVGLLMDEARELNVGFISRLTRERPWTFAKWAQTLDGKTATATGDSQWISNAESRKLVHQWRSEVDAIIVGVQTAIKDDPSLTARDVEIKRHARRVVIDPQLRLPHHAKLMQDDGPPVMIVALDQPETHRRMETCTYPPHVEVFTLAPNASGQLPLDQLLTHLAHHHQATHVMVEGGARLIGSMIEQSLIDEVRVFTAPRLLGDSQAHLSLVGGQSISLMSESQPWTLQNLQRIEDDVLSIYRKA